MDHEHERSHASSTMAPTTTFDDDALDPGRSSRSALLRKPDRTVASHLVQRKARDANGVASGAEQAVAAAAPSIGSPLPAVLRSKFEHTLGADLSAVRIHTGDVSAHAAHMVGARAYTVGNDIHFGAGEYDPSSSSKLHLLAHEVAHTVQQSGGARRVQCKLEVSSPSDSLEHEADRAADAMVSGGAAVISDALTLSHHAPRRAIASGLLHRQVRDTMGPASDAQPLSRAHRPSPKPSRHPELVKNPSKSPGQRELEQIYYKNHKNIDYLKTMTVGVHEATNPVTVKTPKGAVLFGAVEVVNYNLALLNLIEIKQRDVATRARLNQERQQFLQLAAAYFFHGLPRNTSIEGIKKRVSSPMPHEMKRALGAVEEFLDADGNIRTSPKNPTFAPVEQLAIVADIMHLRAQDERASKLIFAPQPQNTVFGPQQYR